MLLVLKCISLTCQVILLIFWRDPSSSVTINRCCKEVQTGNYFSLTAYFVDFWHTSFFFTFFFVFKYGANEHLVSCLFFKSFSCFAISVTYVELGKQEWDLLFDCAMANSGPLLRGQPHPPNINHFTLSRSPIPY